MQSALIIALTLLVQLPLVNCKIMTWSYDALEFLPNLLSYVVDIGEEEQFTTHIDINVSIVMQLFPTHISIMQLSYSYSL